jgi:predicted small secreted protein
MKSIISLAIVLPLLTACNFKEGLKETGDGVQQGTQNALEAAKELPADISKASNKVEADIKK